MNTIRHRWIVLLLALVAVGALMLGRPAPARAAVTRRVSLFDLPVSANAPILTSTITCWPGYESTAVRITVYVTAGTTPKLLMTTTRGGVTITPGQFNSGTGLTAPYIYTFVRGISSENTYNFRFDANCTIGELTIEEVTGDVS
jgi:hypothetical protein